MQFSTWIRTTAAAVGTLMMVASGAAPAMAASAADSIVPNDTLGTGWRTLLTIDHQWELENFRIEFVNVDPNLSANAAVQVSVWPSADEAQGSLETVASNLRQMSPGAPVTTSAYGDGGVEQVGCKAAFCERSINFTDGAILVKISVRTAPDQAELMSTTAETLAEAQHNLLVSLSDA